VGRVLVRRSDDGGNTAAGDVVVPYEIAAPEVHDEE
jgi:hypothetical protein